MSNSGIRWRVLRQPVGEPCVLDAPLTARSTAVLLGLLLARGHHLSTDQLVDFIWGDPPPKTSRNSVARFVADLRGSLGDHGSRVVTVDGGYRLDVQAGELDIDVVRSLLSRARDLDRADDTKCLQALDDALEIAGDRPNSTLDELPNTASEQSQHLALRIELLQRRAQVQLRQGAHLAMVAELQQAVDDHPFHEQFWAMLMVALDRSGRPVEALRAAQHLRDILIEVGASPSDDVARIERNILEQTDDRSGRALPLDLETQPHGIPEPATALVGRSNELAELDVLLTEHRMVTIVGLGGSGKTRLALAAVRSAEIRGVTVHRVGLRSIDDPNLVVPTIAAVAGIPSDQGVTDASSLAHALSPHEFVLLLDNCEHQIDACVEIAEALRANAPHVQLLATSRRALHVTDEHTFGLGPLAVPSLHDASADAASVALFIDRAQHHLDLSRPNLGELRNICEICRALGGLPLAIELAAAQLTEITPAALLARVNVGAERALTSADPSLARLTQMLEWSWDGLTSRQQRILARLSVFASGWTIDSANAVCGESASVEADLAEFVAQSLVVTSQHLDTTRYDILEPIREFAQQRLADHGETQIVLDRLATWLLELTDRYTITEHHAYAHLSAGLLPEQGNIVVALTHLSQSGRSEEVAWLGCKSSGVWINHGFSDQLVRWLTPLIEDPALSQRTRGVVLAMLTAAHHTLGNLEALTPLGLRALDAADGEPHEWITVLAGFLGMWSFVSPMGPTADELYELSIDAAEASPSRELGLAVAAMYRGHVTYVMRDYDGAAELFADARRRLAHPGRVLMIVEVGEAMSLFAGGRTDEAVAAVRAWRSVTDTDQWHYILDVIKAVIIGGSGTTDATGSTSAEDPLPDTADRATADLALAVRRLPPAGAWGRAGEIQFAFGLLAAYRGEQELSNELLSKSKGRDTLLIGLVIEHLVTARGLDSDSGWGEVATELWTRVLPPDKVRTTTAELLSWWTLGQGSEGSSVTTSAG